MYLDVEALVMTQKVTFIFGFHEGSFSPCEASSGKEVVRVLRFSESVEKVKLVVFETIAPPFDEIGYCCFALEGFCCCNYETFPKINQCLFFFFLEDAPKT